MISIRLASALLAFSGCSGATVAPPNDRPLPVSFQSALDDWARGPGHYGVSASIILKDGTQWSGTAGRAGAGLIQPEQLIAIASITKTMTGAVILRLAENGVLGLDDPISRWLAPRPELNPSITVRQLLNHTSGVANYTANPALAAANVASPAHQFTRDELLAFVGPPSFAPGARTEYSNTGFLLLAEIAERATGRPIDELYRTLLWEALGLDEIFLPGAGTPPGPVADALMSGSVTRPLDKMAILTTGNAAFGLMATARTVARWGHALFAGTVLTPTSQQAMRTLVPAAGNIPGETGAGLGIRSYRYLGRTQYGHSGGSLLGSSLLLFDPESGVTVAVVMNQGQGADHFQLAPHLLELAAGS